MYFILISYSNTLNNILWFILSGNDCPNINDNTLDYNIWFILSVGGYINIQCVIEVFDTLYFLMFYAVCGYLSKYTILCKNIGCIAYIHFFIFYKNNIFCSKKKILKIKIE